jgi:hypothetical protein
MTRTVDRQGRLTLGAELASQLVIITKLAGGAFRIEPAEAVPKRELWLYKNAAARRAVFEGLDQARRGELTDGPDFEADLG